MKVLAACEFSGIVRDAFLARGHDATSCDLLPSERPGPHITGDIISLFENPANEHRWDLIIAHPPCTYLANSGVRWLYGGKGTTPDPERWEAMTEGAWFFGRMLHAPAVRVAVENPIMHGHARSLIRANALHGTHLADEFTVQTIQPFEYGHPERKATQLWTRNLPPLRPVTDLRPQMADMRRADTDRVHYASPGPERWKERSRTFEGIAAQMAEQWGTL